MNIFRRAPNLAPFSGGKPKGQRNPLKLKFSYVISQLETHQQLPPVPQGDPHSCPSRSISPAPSLTVFYAADSLASARAMCQALSTS